MSEEKQKKNDGSGWGFLILLCICLFVASEFSPQIAHYMRIGIGLLFLAAIFKIWSVIAPEKKPEPEGKTR
jgi:hypothetical protein